MDGSHAFAETNATSTLGVVQVRHVASARADATSTFDLGHRAGHRVGELTRCQDDHPVPSTWTLNTSTSS